MTALLPSAAAPGNEVKNARASAASTCIVQLCRYGDIINILPIAKAISERDGQKCGLVVHREFASILEGVSYVQPIITDEDQNEPYRASTQIKSRFERVMITQVIDKMRARERFCEAYNMEQWRYAGFLDRWTDPAMKTVFDRRSGQREAKLLDSLNLRTRPFILLATEGYSSPFDHGEQLWFDLQRRWNRHCVTLDLKRFRVDRFYDLLGLMDRALGLITIDTGHLHLAAASKVPVVALISDRHGNHWLGTKPRCNVELVMRYREYPHRLQEIHRVVERWIEAASERVTVIEPVRSKVEIKPPQDRPWITVSTVCFNRSDMTRQCLQSLIQCTEKFKLVVTDNASTDGTAALLDTVATREHTKIVRKKRNTGFKDPHNAAFAKDDSPYFCVVNNDVVFSGDWWGPVLAAFEWDDKLAVVGSSHGVCCRLRDNFDGYPADPANAEYVEGSFLVVRRELVEPLGLFSDKLSFMYGEDSDLSLRVREAGLRIAVLDLPVRHLCGQSRKVAAPALQEKIRKHQLQNHEFLKKRWSVYMRRRDFRYDVLLRRTAALGDVVDLTPIVSALKKKWPLAEIRVQTKFPEVFTNNPNVRCAMQDQAPESDFSFDLDLAYERQPHLHTITAYAQACEVDCPLETARLEIYSSQKDRVIAKNLLHPDATEQKWALLHAGPSNWPGKNWLKERWEALITVLHEKGFKVGIVGGCGDWRFASADADFQGMTTIQKLHALIHEAALFVGLDSGPSHIAQATNCPTVVLFGTTLPQIKLMRIPTVIGVQADPAQVPCVGEHHRLPPPVTFSECDGECMRAITVDMVMEGIAKLAAATP